MAGHNELGQMGEELAAAYYQQRKHEIIEQNWRNGHLELDLVTLHNGVLHFVEVKTRSGKQFGYPEMGVTKTKFRHLAGAAASYLRMHGQYKRVQFDILSININGEKKEYFLIEDVFFN
ncbi:MAG: YraN family protein [Flavisolibacter sp.]|jgi:putative endonuclease|nr:YraN family protein [Flavisolibacter sp.]